MGIPFIGDIGKSILDLIDEGFRQGWWIYVLVGLFAFAVLLFWTN